MVSGEMGAFEIIVNDTLIYSKLKTGQFPKPKELEASMDAQNVPRK